MIQDRYAFSWNKVNLKGAPLKLEAIAFIEVFAPNDAASMGEAVSHGVYGQPAIYMLGCDSKLVTQDVKLVREAGLVKLQRIHIDL